MKYFILILAFTGILLQSFSKLVIVLNFQLNREYIAKNLCVKKAEANNCCKGSCHLNKQLEEDEKKDQAPGSNTSKANFEIQLFCQANSGLTVFQDNITDYSFCPYQILNVKAPAFSIFHPPQVS